MKTVTATREDIIREMNFLTAKNMDHLFAVLDGVHLRFDYVGKRKLATLWTFEAAQDCLTATGVDILDEIVAALVQETCAELTQELHLTLKRAAEPNLIGSYDLLPDEYKIDAEKCVKVIEDGFENAKQTFDAKWAIINVSFLTWIKKHGQIELDDSDPFRELNYVGTCKGLRVFVNPYASDTEPVIVGASKAFTVKGEGIEANDVIIDPQTFEPVQTFNSLYSFAAEPSRLGLITIDIGFRGCTF